MYIGHDVYEERECAIGHKTLFVILYYIIESQC